MATGDESDRILYLSLDQLRGPRHHFGDPPPDFEQVAKGLRASVYAEVEWALGPEDSPVIVGMKEASGSLDKTDYQVWMKGKRAPLRFTLGMSESLLEKLKTSEYGLEFSFRDFDSVSPMLIQFPWETIAGQNGTSTRISLAEGASCRVLVGFKEIDSAAGQAIPAASQTVFSRT